MSNENKVAEIKLTQGMVAIVDIEDYEYVSKFNWGASHNGWGVWYAVRRPPKGERGRIRLHRFILNAPDDMFVDHINGNGLDCRKSNLRLCTNAENGRNSKIPITNLSGYKGVCWHKATQKWIVQINVNGKRTHIGLFENKLDAAIAYNDAAVRYYGEFAKLNNI